MAATSLKLSGEIDATAKPRGRGADEPFGCKAVEDLVQGTHRRAVSIPHSLQCQFLAGREAPVHGVGPDSAVVISPTGVVGAAACADSSRLVISR